ncbi:MAG: malto-oligosyltrehalose synthase, partial [Chloroflexota bacterium]
EQLSFVAKFQQTTGPVMAKGLEDTAFYIYNRLVSLNEVGGDPDQFGVSLTSFHKLNARRQVDWPASLAATSTHDSKRGEDVRARINVLSELPGEWRAALTRWSRLNGRKKVPLEGRMVPDRNEEYLLYQVLLGTWPFEVPEGPEYASYCQRIASFMVKASKEAKVNTSWINPNTGYEDGLQQFVMAVLDPADGSPFLEDFRALAARVAEFGMFNSLSQTVLKVALPGVPDFYQGSEIWSFTLVDPDNRREVDYDLRRGLLSRIQDRLPEGDWPGDETVLCPLAEELLASRTDGRVKLYAITRMLDLRRRQACLFASGAYQPLRGLGSRKGNVFAFARASQDAGVVVVTPILVAGVTGRRSIPPVGEAVWGGTWVSVPGNPGDAFRDVFTGQVLRSESVEGVTALPLGAVLGAFPVSCLLAENRASWRVRSER